MNPLLKQSGAPFGAPEFDKFTKDDYLPAFEEAISLAKAEIDRIAADPEPPTYENTIEALEYSGEALSKVEGIFFNLLDADGDDRMQEIAEEVSPKLTEYSLYVSMNRALFERVKAVRDGAGELDPTRRKLLDETYRSFTRSGAALPEEQRAEFGKLMEELSLLELRFSNNLLSATNAFEMVLDREEDLDGLPEYVREGAAEAAKEKGKSGWLFNLQFPSFSPFMKYSTRRDLREKMWRAYNSRALGGPHDNTALIKRIVGLRAKVAGMLGFGTYADYALEPRMAKNRETVEKFLGELTEPALPVARKEVAELEAYARSKGFEGGMMPWDFSYWAEKCKKEKYDIDDQLLKPYFQLEKCIDAVFGLATKLYGITFRQRTDIPVYHPDVKVYDVNDENGAHLALFYADFFPRATKRGGAWMTEFRGQYMRGGEDFRPFISIVTNFSKPTPGKPSLLTHSELETFLHEFGHSLHGMLSRGRYPSLCGTNVARDFVELPSQIMENWAYEPEYLDSFARHYETGETLPREYIEKIRSAKNFLSGYYHIRQLQFGIVDMAWHTLTSVPEEDVESFEKRVLGPVATLPHVEGSAVCPSFSHIFAGGYSAGYYSYKWAEVLEADAFSLFSEKGIFSREVASSFRRNILEKGSSEEESVLYKNFRGHDPAPEALLKKLGIISD
ncbi:MAG: M3 family metallopeptidase [Bacteroidales bacterium]|nr:M3 family metallopeptidase [Bacteroidales bacterium]